jgi:hypothetical protein
MKLQNQHLLLRCNVPSPHVWLQVIQPPQPATLSCPVQTFFKKSRKKIIRNSLLLKKHACGN